MNRKKSTFFINSLLGLFIMIILVLLAGQTGKLSLDENLVFFLNFILISYGIINAKKDISLYKTYLYFSLFFLTIAPYNQLISGYTPWGKIITTSEVIKASMVIFVFNFIFIVIYKKKYQKELINKNNDKKLTEIPTTRTFFNWLFWISTLSFVFGVFLIGFSNLFVRGEATVTGSPFAIMINFLIRSIPVLSLSIFLFSKKSLVPTAKGFKFNSMTILLLGYTILLNFPTSLSRFLVGSVYLGILISFLPKKFWRHKKFDIMALVVIVLLFPLFYLFKNFTLSQLLNGKVQFQAGDFNKVDFDAFTLIGRTIRYTEDFGFQLGEQLQGTFFFFVPRFIYDLKGVPSGELVAEAQNFFFTNVSEPIMAEAYIDFGYIGVISYGVIFAVLLAKIDAFEETASVVKGKIFFVQPLNAFLLGFIIYISRGALQPSFLRLMGFFLFLILLYLFTKLKNASKAKVTLIEESRLTN